MQQHSSPLGVVRVCGVIVAMVAVMALALLFMHKRDVERTFPEPLTSPAYFDDYYDDPTTRPTHLVAGDRIMAATRNARRP